MALILEVGIQLKSLKHNFMMMKISLQHTDSAYFPCFKSMFKNVVTALAEARDITLYLSPLMKHFLQVLPKI